MLNVGRAIGVAGLLALMLAAAPEGVLAQKKKKDADNPLYPTATEADYAALKATMFPATIITLTPGQSVTIRAEFTHQEKNPKPLSTDPKAPGYNQQYAQLTKKLTDLQTRLQLAGSGKAGQQAQAKIQAEMAPVQTQLAAIKKDPANQPMLTVKSTKDYDFDFEKKVVYRKMKPILDQEVDKEGNTLKYGVEELLRLRGDEVPHLPGYIAKMDDIKEGQEVKLYFTLPKKKAKTDDDKTPPEHATIKMIVATKPVGAVSSPPPAVDPPKKKKN